MSARTWFMRCGDCLDDYVAATNLLDGKPLWSSPKRKRGGCQHDPANVELFAGNQGWIRQGTPIDELNAEQTTEARVALLEEVAREANELVDNYGTDMAPPALMAALDALDGA